MRAGGTSKVRTRTVILAAPTAPRVSTAGARTRAAASGTSRQAAAQTPSRPAAPKAPSRLSIAAIQAMTATSPFPAPRPWRDTISLAELRLRLELAGTVPPARPEGLAPPAMPAAFASEVLVPDASALGLAFGVAPDLALAAPSTAVGATGPIADYRAAVLAASAAAEAQDAAEAALAAYDEARPPASADILARMDQIAMLGTADGGDRAEFAALREAYDAAVIAETESRAEAGRRAALAGAAREAGAASEAALAALAPAFGAVTEGRPVSPEIAAELHRLLGIEDAMAVLAARGTDLPDLVASPAGTGGSL